jgi:EpsI family protein
MLITRSIITALLILGGAVSLQFLSVSEQAPPRKGFAEFPRNIGPWQGKESRFDDAVYDILGVEDSFLAGYMAPENRYVQLYIGYYESQRKGDLIHSPKNCMPGAGWKIVHTDYTDVPRTDGPPAKVIKLTLQNGKHKQLMLYWFHSRGRVIASEYWQKIYLVWDSITRHRTDGSFVRLISPMVDGKEDQALNTLVDFAEALFPLLNDYIPS